MHVSPNPRDYIKALERDKIAFVLKDLRTPTMRYMEVELWTMDDEWLVVLPAKAKEGTAFIWIAWAHVHSFEIVEVP